QRLVGVRESGQVIEKECVGGPIPGGGGREFEDLTKKFVGAPPVGGGEERAEHGLLGGEVMWGFGACRGDGCECHNGGVPFCGMGRQHLFGGRLPPLLRFSGFSSGRRRGQRGRAARRGLRVRARREAARNL